MAHPQTNFSSNFQGVDPPLEGYWHDDPIPCGGGNVVTDIWPNPAGVPVVVKGFNALTDEDIADKLDNTGNASNTTATFTKASGDTSTMTSGSKLSAIFTAISSFFASVASALGGKADKANITGATKCKITYNGQGIVTSGADLGASDIPNLAASKITSGTFGTDRIADDAITAAKVKDNETLPVSVNGTAAHLSTFGKYDTWNSSYDSSKPYVVLAEVQLLLSSNTGAGQLFQLEFGNGDIAIFRLNFILKGSNVTTAKVSILYSTWSESGLTNRLAITYFKYNNDTRMAIYIYFKFTGDWQVVTLRQLDAQTGNEGRTNWEAAVLYTGTGSDKDSIVGTIAPFSYNALIGNSIYSSKIGSHTSHPQIGSPATPVYVDPDGQVKACDPSGGVMKSNTAELYIAGYTDDNIPYYHVRNIKNGCVNHVNFSGITNSTCNITFEAPTLSTGEEYDYIISLEGYTNNSGYSTGSDVENCKQVLHYDYVNNLWVGEPLFLQATDWRQICVVRGNTYEWKRVALS